MNQFRSRILDDFSGQVLYGVTTRKDGRMNYKKIKGDEDTQFLQLAAANRSQIFFQKGIDANRVFYPFLVHGTQVALVSDEKLHTQPEADAAITDIPGISLVITQADCLPVFLFDPFKEVVGIVHAGWRGVARRAVPIAIEAMITAYGCASEDIRIAVGPCIQQCHFHFTDNSQNHFGAYDQCVREENGGVAINLPAIVGIQAQEIGVSIRNISLSTQCTFCSPSPLYFSYRRDGVNPATSRIDLNMAYIQIRP